MIWGKIMINLFRKYLCSFIGVAILFFCGVSPGLAETTRQTGPLEIQAKTSLDLTEKEKTWLAEHKTINVAFDGYFPPYSFLNDQGKFEGLAVDIFQVLARRMGITIKISPLVVWKELYQAAQRREIDVVATMGRQPVREKWFIFTQPYIFKSLVIMTQKETQGISKPGDLEGKRVALVEKYQYVKPVLEKYPLIKPFYVDTMLDGLNAVSMGKADAAIIFIGAV
jgi:ABC-type amino acid transport substrate-binding protein